MVLERVGVGVADVPEMCKGRVVPLLAPRYEVLPAEEGGEEVQVNGQGGHLSIGDGKLDPTVVQDFPKWTG